MSVSTKHLGGVIAKLRQERHLTQQQLAGILGVSHQAVSKWETGAALPDIDSLMALSQLFGVTIDQMVRYGSSDFYSDVKDGIKTAADYTVRIAKTVGSAIADTACSIASTVTDLCKGDSEPDEACSSTISDEQSPVDEGKETPEEAADEAEAVDSAEGEEKMTLEQLLELAPFMGKEKLSALLLDSDHEVSTDRLLEFAPFLTQPALEELIRRLDSDALTIDFICDLAPFMSRDTLFRLTAANVSKLDMNALRSLAPFLKKSMVDELLDVVTKVKKSVDLDAVGDFTVKAGKKAVSLFSQFKDATSKVVSDLAQAGKDAIKPAADPDRSEEAPVCPAEGAEVSTPNAAAEAPSKSVPGLKDKIARAALDSGNWAWLRGHLSSVSDIFLLQDICTAASDLEPADARDILLNALPYLPAENAAAVVEQLASVGKLELAEDLLSFAPGVCDSLLLAAFQSRDLDRIRRIAPLASAEQLTRLTELAISNQDWPIIEALDSAL